MAAFNKEAEQTRSLLRQLGVRPQRLRGQNFLIDPAAIQRIAAVGFDWPWPRRTFPLFGGEGRQADADRIGAGLCCLSAAGILCFATGAGG